MAGQPWTVRLSAAAESDFRQILRWTAENFGAGQVHLYSTNLSSALEDLCAGSDVIGAQRRDEIGTGIYTLHVAKKGRKGRHFILFRLSAMPAHQFVDVLRILHDSMDLERHLLPEDAR